MNEDLSHIKSDMKPCAGGHTQKDLDFYHEMLCKYQNDIGMAVTWAGSFGDVKLLNKLSASGKYNPLFVTPVENWNYLHKCNLNSGSPYPLDVVKFYIDKGVPVNAQDIYGMTPLHYAMEAENGDAAMVLLEAGADPNIETYADQGFPLAMIGGIPDRLAVLKAMLDKGADVHHPVKNVNMSLLDFMKTYFSDDQSLKPVIALMEQYA